MRPAVRGFAALAATAVVGMVFGYALGIRSTTPLQAEAERQVEEIESVPFTVEKRALSETMELDAAKTDIELFQFELAAAAPIQVVTKPPTKRGDTVDAGTVLIEISGRPVFLILGDTPAYRDLGPGLRGDDLVGVQETLRQLGFYEGEVDGYWGWETTRAVRELYRSQGYDPPTRVPEAASPRPDGATGPTAPQPTTFLPYSEYRIVTGKQTVLDAPTLGQSPPLTISLGVLASSFETTLSSDQGARARQATRSFGLVDGREVEGSFSVVDDDTTSPPSSRLVFVPVSPVDRVDRVVLVLAETAGPVMVVPISALTFQAEIATVTVNTDSGPQSVQVQIGVVADGWAEIMPLETDGLVPGQVVQVPVP